MTFEDVKLLHEQGDNIYYALQSLLDIMSKKQMSADEWRDLDSARARMHEYERLIRAPYGQVRNAERRLAQAREVLASATP